MFDPHLKTLPRSHVNVNDPGMRINFVKSSDKLHSIYPNQFKPYQNLFGCDLKKSFKGTLFRFPLRTTTDSLISQSIYSREQVLQMLQTFITEAAMDVLSLKHVERIKVFHQTSNSNSLIYELTATPATEHDQAKRERINDLLRDAIVNIRSKQTPFDNYTYHLNVKQEYIEKNKITNQQVCLF